MFPEACRRSTLTEADGGNIAVEPVLSLPERSRLLRRASLASVITAVALILLKLAAWLATGSVSLLASLVDSLMDSLASLVNLLALRYSLQPPDAEHRFGHGKAEPLAGLAQACFIAGSALFLGLHAVERLREPRALDSPVVAVVVMLAATVITAGLLTLQRHVIRRTGSTAIRADALHYATDLLTNLGVLLAIVLAAGGMPLADPVLALLVTAYIFYSAVRIAIEAVGQLMDAQLPAATREAVLERVLSHPEVRGAHDMRTRQAGQLVFVELHLELDGSLPLRRAHAIGDQVAVRIREVLPDASVLIHHDPVAPTSGEV